MEAPTANYYDVLGVAPDVSHDELRRAYTTKAFRLHPDRQSGVSADELERAEWMMRELNAAWEVLRDSKSRRRYDEELAAARAPRAEPTFAWHDIHTENLPDLEPAEEELPTLSTMEFRLARFAPIAVIGVVLLLILIVTAYAGDQSDGDPDVVTTEAVPVGSCVQVLAGPQVLEVECSYPNSGEVIDKVPFPQPCPTGSRAVAIPAEGLSFCLVDQ